MFVYLDNSSTTRQDPQVTRLMCRIMEENFGNPSSLHRLGLEAEKLMKKARQQVAQSMGAAAGEIFFTSGGTEADHIAIMGSARALKRMGNKIITSQVEHPAVLENFRALEQEGFQAVYLDVDEKGVIDLKQLEAELDENTVLVSLMQVNNELGSLEPVEQAGALIKKRSRANFHIDAVQGLGKLPVDPSSVKADLVAVSAHKIHGPKGCGALYMKKGTRLKSPVYGGGQEQGIRSGTENLPGDAGFGLAAELAAKEFSRRNQAMKEARRYLLEGIKAEIGDVRINSFEDERCVASVLNVSFLGTRGEVLLHMLEQKEIYVSTGSACSSHHKGQSHVLKAAGLSEEEMEGAIRFSFSHENTRQQMEYTLEQLKKAVESMRRVIRRK